MRLGSAGAGRRPAESREYLFQRGLGVNDRIATIELLESRLTLLERQFARFQLEPETGRDEPPASVNFRCDDPGLVVSKGHHLETDSAGRPYCWVGGPGAIQIVFPLAPRRRFVGRLDVRFHRAVSWANLRVLVNDEEAGGVVTEGEGGSSAISFIVEPGRGRRIEVSLLNLTSVRPSELGESADERLIAFCFYRAEFKACA